MNFWNWGLCVTLALNSVPKARIYMQLFSREVSGRGWEESLEEGSFFLPCPVGGGCFSIGYGWSATRSAGLLLPVILRAA